MKTKKLLLLASVLAGLSASVRAAPEILSYSGRITVSGQPFAGQGHFKFALVNRTGQVSYWANDGNFTVAQEPAQAVAATVTDGEDGLEVVRVLEASKESLARDGARVRC